MAENLKLLVVEDDHALRDALLVTLEAAGHRAQGAADGPAALALLGRGRFNMVISDLRMAPMDGLELLGEIRQREPTLPVLLMTAFGDVDKAVAAMRGGACDFMLKPFEPRALLDQIARYATQAPEAAGVIAADPKTRELLLLASRVARTDATVLLTGESGTGKEVFARYIHDQSPRKGGPFVAINCAAIPDNLVEATLFGHEKGAYTGAQAAQAGKFEQASGGTLLLDEISEMPMTLQAKLLRVLQEGTIRPVGATSEKQVDVRIICATNRDLSAEVEKARFRQDLYYRLMVFPIKLPPLRERREDIPLLGAHFLKRYADEYRLEIPGFTQDALDALSSYNWPGNIRELENEVQRLVIQAEPGHWIEITDLSPRLRKIEGTVTRIAPKQGTLKEMMEQVERWLITEALRDHGGNKTKTAMTLGITREGLHKKLAKFGV